MSDLSADHPISEQVTAPLHTTSRGTSAVPPPADTAATPSRSAHGVPSELSDEHHSLPTSSPDVGKTLPSPREQSLLSTAVHRSVYSSPSDGAPAADDLQPLGRSPLSPTSALPPCHTRGCSPEGTQRTRCVGASACANDFQKKTVQAGDIVRWKKSAEYERLRRDLRKVLCAIDATSLTDWATQAALLTQLLKCIQNHKDVIGAVELPDSAHFAKTTARMLCPQYVAGVQRKTLEVLQSYLGYVNPVYPLVKELPSVLQGLLGLLPQASMQVKTDVLELLDVGVVRRLTASALRGCAQGLLAALLTCLEEAETSPMHRKAMAMLEYMQATLTAEDSTPAASSTSSPSFSDFCVVHEELRGGQVLAAHLWLILRDAATLRPPALTFMKSLIAQAHAVPSTAPTSSREDDRGGGGDAAPLPAPLQTAASRQQDWVGGDPQTVVAALLNCLQDVREKTHRLVLDVLMMVCPLGVSTSGCTSADDGAEVWRHQKGRWRDSSFAHSSGDGPFDGRMKREILFPFQTQALLVAAAVQLLGSRYGKPSVTRRIIQWLTVNPGEALETSGLFSGDGVPAYSPVMSPTGPMEGIRGASDVADPFAGSPQRELVFVPEVTSLVLMQGVHLLVDHWRHSWSPSSDKGSPSSARQDTFVMASLAALQRTAIHAMSGLAALRLARASSVAAALGKDERGQRMATGLAVEVIDHSGARSEALMIAAPLIWLRALLVLFRYKTARHTTGDSPASLLESPEMMSDGTQYLTPAAGTEAVCAPFLDGVAVRLLPSICRLIAGVSELLSRPCRETSTPALADLWKEEVHELLRVLPLTMFVELDTIEVETVKTLLHAEFQLAEPRESEDAAAAALSRITPTPSSPCALERVGRDVCAQMDHVYAVSRALNSTLMIEAVEQPLRAQEYVRASLGWMEKVASLLNAVLVTLQQQFDHVTLAPSAPVCAVPAVTDPTLLSVLIRVANGLLRLLAQRMQDLVEPMADCIMAAATPSVGTAEFRSSLMTVVDSCVLQSVRNSAVSFTDILRPTLLKDVEGADHPAKHSSLSSTEAIPVPLRRSGSCVAEVQNLLVCLHRTTLRFTSFATQLHLRCRRLASSDVALYPTAAQKVAAQEQELAKQTERWLGSLCDGALCAVTADARIAFTGFLRLVLDTLLRTRGSLVPLDVYRWLEPDYPTQGGIPEGVSFANAYILAPLILRLWQGCEDDRVAAPQVPTSATDELAERVDVCQTLLVMFVAVSPACARCFDTFLLETPLEKAVPCLVRLLQELTELRQQQRFWQHRSSTIAAFPASQLKSPGVLILGYVTVLRCLLQTGTNLIACHEESRVSEHTRQLACSFVSQAIILDLRAILLPLYMSFLSPMMRKPTSNSLTADDATRERSVTDATAEAAQGISVGSEEHLMDSLSFTLPLTVLLPCTKTSSDTSASMIASTSYTRWFAEKSRGTSCVYAATPRVFRSLEAAELVHIIFVLLQLPTAAEWVCLSMNTPAPNSLHVPLSAMEAQFLVSSTAGHSESSVPPSTPYSPITATPAERENINTVFAVTALLLLNFARHTLISMHNDHMNSQVTRHTSQEVEHPRNVHNISPVPTTGSSGAPVAHQESLLLDSLIALNRLLDFSQTTSFMQPHRCAVFIWQHTSAQLLPLLRLAVEAGTLVVQTALLDHMRGVVLYLDDASSMMSARRFDRHRRESTNFFTSRHWSPHPLLQVGVASLSSPHGPSNPFNCKTTRRGFTATASSLSLAPSPKTASHSSTPLLEDLHRVPSAVFSDQSLYNLIIEVILAATAPQQLRGPVSSDLVCACSGGATRHAAEDKLKLWLHFYEDVMPYLYRDLVPSSEMVIDALLSVLDPAPTIKGHTVVPVQVWVLCCATLRRIAKFLCHVARVADEERCEEAALAKQSMSWIASTFTQDDPTTEGRKVAFWERAPELMPIRSSLSRIVKVAAHGMDVCDEIVEKGSHAREAVEDLWARDWDDRETEGRSATHLASVTSRRDSEAAMRVLQYTSRMLRLLHEVSGKELLIAFVRNWCAEHATCSRMWIFEDRSQRMRRVAVMSRREVLRVEGGTVPQASSAPSPGAVDRSSRTVGREDCENHQVSLSARTAAQRAASVLLRGSMNLPLAEVVVILASEYHSAMKLQAQQNKSSPSPVHSSPERIAGAAVPALSSSHFPPPGEGAQVLYFLDTLVESSCVEHQEGLTVAEAETVMSVMADMVSQTPLDSLSFCCLFHTLYCVVEYAAKDDGEDGNTAARAHPNGSERLAASESGGTSVLTRSMVHRNPSFAFVLCHLLENLRISSAIEHYHSTLLSLYLLCQLLRSVLPPSPLGSTSTNRLMDVATQVLRQSVLPTLRLGIASASEADIVHIAPLVCACLRTLRVFLTGFAPSVVFDRRAQRDLVALLFSEHFFRYSRSALHEWALLLRQWSQQDRGFGKLVCERLMPSPGRLSSMLMSREAEMRLRERSLQHLAFYTYAVFSVDAPAATSNGLSGVDSGLTAATGRYPELAHLIHEQFMLTVQHFSTTSIPTSEELRRGDVFLQPITAALLVFRVLLLCRVQSLVASLWPQVLPEVLRILSIDAYPFTNEGDCRKATATSLSTVAAAATSTHVILAAQMEALKVLDTDYTLDPAHALAFRWLFTDDTVLPTLAVLKKKSTAAVKEAPHRPVNALRHSCVVSELEVLHLLRAGTPNAQCLLNTSAVCNAVHEPGASGGPSEADTLQAPSLGCISTLWPPSARPSMAEPGLRRPLFAIPTAHYPRVDGVHRAAQAFVALLQRVNRSELECAHSPRDVDLRDTVMAVTNAGDTVGVLTGSHNEVDISYMQDLLEADFTTTDPDTTV